MTRIVMDAFAWIEYFDGTERGMKVAKIIEDKENEIFTSLVTVAEIISIAKRKVFDADEVSLALSALSKMQEINKSVSVETGLFHAEMKKREKDFGLADSFVVIAARQLEAKILTGDPHFKGMKEAVLI